MTTTQSSGWQQMIKSHWSRSNTNVNQRREIGPCQCKSLEGQTVRKWLHTSYGCWMRSCHSRFRVSWRLSAASRAPKAPTGAGNGRAQSTHKRHVKHKYYQQWTQEGEGRRRKEEKGEKREEEGGQGGQGGGGGGGPCAEAMDWWERVFHLWSSSHLFSRF